MYIGSVRKILKFSLLFVQSFFTKPPICKAASCIRTFTFQLFLLHVMFYKLNLVLTVPTFCTMCIACRVTRMVEFLHIGLGSFWAITKVNT
jgi:hypothetical protein